MYITSEGYSPNGVSPSTVILKALAYLAVVPCLMLLLTFSVSAQKTSGQINGSVLDPQGAAVPAATVTVTQLETGISRTTTTSDDGNFIVPDLPIGTYRVAASKSGFKETVAEGVTVNVSSVTRQDFNLEIGGIGETVTIQSSDIQVETETGAIGEVVTGQQVRELPLNGRSFVQLTQLQPGVSPQNNFDSKNKGLFSGVDFSVNGNSAQSNLFLTDGANNNDTGSNRTILLYPSIEAIAEFKMLRNSYGPEYGQAAGSVISIATRGGTNEFHGSLFYFGRNDALNAREYFTTRVGGDIDKLRRHDYGGSIGGPILKDRLFFFYSQEFNKEIRGGTRFGSVPTLAERQGDFRNRRILTNGTSCSGAPIGGGRPGSDTQVIPTASISPAGRLLTQLYPEPNLAWSPTSGTCNNWAESLASSINFREENGRIDYNINKSNQLFGRYTQDHWTNPFPILFGAGLWGDDAFPGVESDWAQPSKQAAIKLTTTLSSTSINEVQFSYSANRINIIPGVGGDLNRQINEAIPGYFNNKVNGNDRPHPVFWGGIQPFTSNRGADLWTQAPFKNSLDIYSIRDDFSKVMGDHSFKMGFLFDKAAKIEDAGPSNEAPQFWGNCCSNNSGNYLADILTRGSFFGFGESDKMAVGNAHYTNLEFYVGDTWKLRPNLTLELGARYSILFEPYDSENAISSFDLSAFNPALGNAPCNGLVVPKGTNPCAGIAGAVTPVEFSNRSLRKNNYKNLAPRLGIAWDVFKNGKTAVRGGFGQFFLRERVSPIVAALTGNPPFIRSTGGQRTLDGPAVFNLDFPASTGAPQYGYDPRAATPYSLQFNVAVDQELWKNTVLEVAYVGNRARNQLTNYSINPVLPQNRVAAAFAPSAGDVNVLRALGVNSIGSIYQFARRGRADYDSLQVLFKTRFWKNSQFQAAYTYGKSRADFGLGDSSGGRSDFALQDIDNPDLDFGPSDINRPHLFVANTVVYLPGFKGSNPFVQTILGGWEFATIVQITSGTSITPNIAATGLNYDPDGPGGTDPRNFQGGFTGTGTAVANQRPLFVGNCSGSGNPENVLNPNAYTLVGTRIGELSSQDSKGGCLGPGIKNVDMSLYKNFSPGWLTESFLGEGARIQFRLEMFNAFNTPQFRGDSVGISYYGGRVVCGANPCSPSNNVITGIINSDGTPAGPNGNFGVAGNTRGGREIQYALKLIF